jgi:putative FmdB family regulatory protein
MPTYAYQPDDRSCAYCVYGFERLEKLADEPLRACPACGQPCHRALAAPAIVTGTAHLLREKHIAEHGFSQYRRTAKGEYEKTTGDGPDTISG